MKKFGFTLAEVMVALVLIGVITSLTIPTFVASNKNRSHATKLAVAVSAIENAFSSMQAVESAQNMNETRFGREPNSENLGRYLKIIGSNPINDYYGGNNPFRTITGDTNPDISEYTFFETKNGTLIAYDRGSRCLAIDVNGGNAPNVWARDVFFFIVGQDGSLNPAGGEIFNNLAPEPLNCNDADRGAGCTAELVENNYEVSF